MIPKIDLHKFFRDKDKTRQIIDMFLQDMYAQGIEIVRIVHGKGKGDFKNLVHSYLENHDLVDGYTLCDHMHGGGGATFVHLKKVGSR